MPPEQGLGWSKEMTGLSDYARMATANGLSREKTSQKSGQIFRKAALVTDTRLKEILSALDTMSPEQREANRPKCSYGCAYCCYQWVRCTAMEVFVVADHIRATWPEEKVSELISALALYRIEFQKIPPNTISSLCCPLLVDNVCSVYEVRPFICRGCNSLDVEACRLGMLDPEGGTMIPVAAPLITVAGAMRTGIGNGLRDAGLQSVELAFGLALETALTVPDAADRYFAGESVFEGDVAHSIKK